jgi:predicted anti-sigma-YlaC factor YlaD
VEVAVTVEVTVEISVTADVRRVIVAVSERVWVIVRGVRHMLLDIEMIVVGVWVYVTVEGGGHVDVGPLDAVIGYVEIDVVGDVAAVVMKQLPALEKLAPTVLPLDGRWVSILEFLYIF